jgi:DNA-binding HxlR family transcriptional regulator
MKNHFGCPIQATSNVLTGKWKVLIVWHLGFGSRRFAEIRDLLPGVTEKVLTDQLRQLERDGIIIRVSSHTVPPRVDYSLSHLAPNISASRPVCLPAYRCRHSKVLFRVGRRLAALLRL